MKVGFDVSPLKDGHKARGVGFYSKNLIDNLKKVTGIEIIEMSDLNNPPQVDLVHIPYFDFYFRTLPKMTVPTVVTVHDATPLVFKKQYPAGIRGEVNLYFQKKALQQCRGVITVSNNAKEDIQKYLGIPAEKIHVVYSAAAEHFKVINDKKKLEKVSKKYGLPSQFALYVGNVNWNKNILNMAKAAIDANINLYIVGSAFLNTENINHPEMKSFKLFLEDYSKHPNIHLLGFVEDDELVSLYNLATMTLFVSYYEGFGFPILESQSCGTPVITSNCSSMPEVAGDSAILVDPDNSKEITQAIIRLKEERLLREDLIAKGFKNLKRFSWSKSAAQTYEVYQSVMR